MTYNFCQKCFTRFDACETCHAAELAEQDRTTEAIITDKDAEILRLRAALREIAVQVGVHFDERYTMNGFLAKDEHGEMCYFNDILEHLEQYTKKALEEPIRLTCQNGS